MGVGKKNTMSLWAAIDLIQGRAVTLVRGNEKQKTVWNEEPTELAERWQADGADGLHLIDLDAAFARGSNEATITKILESVELPVQVGGGIRSEEPARRWLDGGAQRVIIGTMAYSNPVALENLLRDYGPDRIVVAADYRDGEIVIKGWTEGSRLGVEEVAARFEQAGVVNLLTTCVGRDGTGEGPDLETIKNLMQSRRRLRVMASGGIRDLRDLIALNETGVAGAVIGRAIYEGSVVLAAAKTRIS